MRPRTERFTEWIVSWRAPLLLLGIVTAVIAFFPANRLRFDRSIENMFASDDPLLPPYSKLTRTFGATEVVVALYTDPELFHADGRGIRRVAELSERLRAVPGIRDTLSLDQPFELAHGNKQLEENAKALFQGYTHGEDGVTSAVVCILQPESEAAATRSETIDRMRDVMSAYPSGMITGAPVMVTDGFDYVAHDGRVLGWATTVLLGIVIGLNFRSLRWMIVPVAVVQLTILLTRATLVLSGIQLSMVSSMLTAIVTVVGVATVIHVIVRFREARQLGLPPREAMLRAGPLLVVPVALACTTDAVGFISLMLAEVGPIQDFGLMMAIGAMLVLVAAVLLVPGLGLIGRFDPDPKRAWGEGRLETELRRTVHWVEHRPKTILLTTLVVAVGAAAGAYRLEVETDFTKNYRASSPIVQSYQFAEAHLGGAAVWDVIVPVPARDGQPVFDWDLVRRVRRLEYRLMTEIRVPGPNGRPVPGLTKVLSLPDAVIAASTRDLDGIRISALRNAAFRTGLKMLGDAMPTFVEALRGRDPESGKHYLRVMLRTRERQPASQKLRLIDEVTRISREEFPPTADSPGAEVTGFFVLLTNLIKSIVRDQWLTFGVATAGIGLMLLVAFRSFRLALAALVPNVLPILIVTGLMGWFGFKINMGAAMIAAASMGLSIDSEVHYISAFRRARAEGKSSHEALTTVHQSVGRAVVFSTVALIVGFIVLVTSQFVPIIYFGALVSLTMAGGLVGNLILLPLLLTLVDRDPAR